MGFFSYAMTVSAPHVHGEFPSSGQVNAVLRIVH
jgi:hypothetical protein